MHLTFSTPIGDQGEIRMRVHVYEAWRDHKTSHINDLSSFVKIKPAIRFDRYNNPVLYSDIANKTFGTSAIENFTTLAAAESWCAANASCEGFTVSDNASDTSRRAYFKAGITLSGGRGWSSYVKTGRAPPPYGGAQLQQIWVKTSSNGHDMLEAMKQWVHEAEVSGIQSLREFAEQLKTYSLRPSSATA